MNERLSNGLTIEQDAAFEALAQGLADHYREARKETR